MTMIFFSNYGLGANIVTRMFVESLLNDGRFAVTEQQQDIGTGQVLVEQRRNIGTGQVLVEQRRMEAIPPMKQEKGAQWKREQGFGRARRRQ